MHLRLLAIVTLTGILAVQSHGVAFAGPRNGPVDENGGLDVISVDVRQAAGSDWVATVSLQNDENLAAMTLPFLWRPQPAHFRLDSASYAGLRTEYFSLKTFYPDTIAGTILIGLISNLGTDRPPLEPGNGAIARLYFTAMRDPSAPLQVDTTFIRPFNILQLVTPDVQSIFPAFRTTTEGPSDLMKQPGIGASQKTPDGR